MVSATASSLYWKRVGSGYQDPVDVKALGGGRFLLLEKPGRISLTDFKGNSGVILDWTDRIRSKGQEQGFLSIALAPNFSSTGRAYFNILNHTTRQKLRVQRLN